MTKMTTRSSQSLPTLTLITVLLLSLTACDSVEDDPMVEITFDSVAPIVGCDAENDTAGDFHFRFGVVDLSNNRNLALIDRPAGTYGNDGSFGNTLHIADGTTYDVGETATFSLQRDASSGFAVQFSAIEWDSATSRDPRMNDRTAEQAHASQNGQLECAS